MLSVDELDSYISELNLVEESNTAINYSERYIKVQRIGKLSVNGQRVTLFGFVGHVISVTTTQLCHC